MTKSTDPKITDLERRVRVLEQVAHCVLLVVGAAGSMLAEVRHAEKEDT
jgi:hypothetical protein